MLPGLLLLGLALSMLPGAPAQAQRPFGQAVQVERIVDFFGNIEVEASGEIVVTERLLVEVQGRDIQRGLLRDFPTRYRTPDGSRVQVGFEVLQVSRNGVPEPYEEEELSNGVRLRIGSGAMLAHGRHLYEIRYRTTRQIGFFDDFDELYWNVTGTGWSLPIEHARARIVLPEAAPILRTAIYTGPEGATGQAAREFAREPGMVSFETTAPLPPYEGLTVAAAWPKGVVQAPTPREQLAYRLKENLALAASVLGCVLLIAYYLRAWRRLRRRSVPQIVPLFEPPDGMSAPAVRYVARQRYDQRVFVTGMLQLIAGRAIRLRKRGLTDRYERLEETVDDPLLRGMLDKLFRKNMSFTGGRKGARRFDAAREQLRIDLDKTYRKRLFRFEFRTAVIGTLLWFAYVALCVFAAARQSGDEAALLAVSVFTFTPLVGVLTAWLSGSLRLGMFLFALVMIAPWAVVGAMAFSNMVGWGPLSMLPAVLPVAMFPVTMWAYRFLHGYTDEGHRVMDAINGLKRYLGTAEAPRLQALVTAEEQVEFYERLLPYAVALDVGKAWAASFSALFAASAAQQAVDAMAANYGGRDLLHGNTESAMRSFSRDLSPPSPARAATSSGGPGSSGSWSGGSGSSSSSGSSGGGSSGGGGGGGGGSGW